MTRKEVIDFLHDKCECKKGNMKNINNMIQVAKELGLKVTKNGPDDYDLREACLIDDFKKPLKMFRELPEDIPIHKAYSGVPLSLMCDWQYFCGEFNPELYCYLMNKQNGECIDFNEILILKVENCDSIEDIVRYFDYLTYLGYIVNKEDVIECYAYPRDGKRHYPTYKARGYDFPRLTPINY